MNVNRALTKGGSVTIRYSKYYGAVKPAFLWLPSQ
jgi:hypothetical protein